MALSKRRDAFLVVFLVGLTWRMIDAQGSCGSSCALTRETGKLDCESRQLTCIPPNYHGARVMMLAQNSLQTVPRAGLANYRMLRQLDMSNNAIYSVEDNAFNGLTVLSTLNLATNRITKLTANTFRGLRVLQTLLLQGNAIDSIDAKTFTDLSTIIELNLAGNRLTILPEGVFSSLRSLKRLYLHENHLTTDPNMPFLNGLSSLVELDLDGNRFTNIPSMRGLARLTDLDITDTHIKTIHNGSFADLSSVRDIILNSNMISNVEPGAFEGLSALSELDLSFNVITELPVEAFRPLFNVERLQMQNNQLQVLTTQHFASMSRLTSLNLEGNQLAVFPPMPNVRMLSTLNLKSNRLDAFAPQTLQSFPLLKRLLLIGNPLQCDCRAQRLRQWFLTTTHPAPHHPNEIPRCNAMEPRGLRGSRLTAVQPSDLQCRAPVIRPYRRMISIKSGLNATLSCASSGFPRPKVTWVAPSGLRLNPLSYQSPNQRLRITEDGRMLVAYASPADEGTYSCIMANPAGQVQGAVRLMVKPPPPEAPGTNSTMSNGIPPNKPSTHNPEEPQITTNTQEMPTDPFDSTSTPHITSGAGRDTNSQGSGSRLPHHDQHVDHTSTQLNPTVVIGDRETSPHRPLDPRTPQCATSGSGDVAAAVLLTFLFTASLTGILFFLWYRRWLPRVLLSGRHKGILTLSGRRRLSSKPPRPAQMSHARRLRSYERVDESRGASSYFSDSEDTISTASSYDSARYVITESVTDPDSIRIRQLRLAAVSAQASNAKQTMQSPQSIQSQSEAVRSEGKRDAAPPTVARSPTSKTSSTTSPSTTIKLPGPLAALKNKATGRKTHIYQNADMVVHDPNYSALWPGPKQGQYQYPRKHSGESRIYIDLS
ncbi:uncharacterized protein [Diadema setosum]|uniref:uncharacterized protein n=1 Tax=Diadema setosum TaxID=31175 RepID=UPI003B3B6D77